MKWTNKGHEFDALGEKFIQDSHIYIYGAGDYGKRLFSLLDWLEIECTFIDGNRQKQKEGYLGQKVLSPVEFLSIKEKKNVVLAAVPRIANEMKLILEEQGYELNCDFWMLDDFCRNILSVYLSYVKNRTYMDSVCLIMTTVCNLNCDACLNFNPYNKHQKHEELEVLKGTIDCYFRSVDYVKYFACSGGEPLLYPYLDELLDYIGDNYANKFYYLGVSTNGTIVPKDSTCELLKKYNFKLLVEDYSTYVEKSKMIVPQIIEKLNDYGISYGCNIGEDGYWIDFAPFETDNSHMSEEELIEYRRCCGVPYRNLKNGKLYSCNYASFAMTAGIQSEEENDWYDLSIYEKENDKILMEFIMGYTEKGYVDFCKHCAGFLSINPHRKPVGKQLERY